MIYITGPVSAKSKENGMYGTGHRSFFIQDQHKICKSHTKHRNHVSEPSRSGVLKDCTQMKELAQISNDQPSQIISNVAATISREIQ